MGRRMLPHLTSWANLESKPMNTRFPQACGENPDTKPKDANCTMWVKASHDQGSATARRFLLKQHPLLSQGSGEGQHIEHCTRTHTFQYYEPWMVQFTLISITSNNLNKSSPGLVCPCFIAIVHHAHLCLPRLRCVFEKYMYGR